MSLFAQGRVLITPQPEYMAGFPTGKVPDARQPLSVDRSLVPFFTDPRVISKRPASTVWSSSDEFDKVVSTK